MSALPKCSTSFCIKGLFLSQNPIQSHRMPSRLSRINASQYIGILPHSSRPLQKREIKITSHPSSHQSASRVPFAPARIFTIQTTLRSYQSREPSLHHKTRFLNPERCISASHFSTLSNRTPTYYSFDSYAETRSYLKKYLEKLAPYLEDEGVLDKLAISCAGTKKTRDEIRFIVDFTLHSSNLDFRFHDIITLRFLLNAALRSCGE